MPPKSPEDWLKDVAGGKRYLSGLWMLWRMPAAPIGTSSTTAASRENTFADAGSWIESWGSLDRDKSVLRAP
jgi:hypothetical protein